MSDDLIERLEFCAKIHPQIGYPQNGKMFAEAAARIAALKAERDELREALRFYACPETWEQSPRSSDELGCTEADFDQGHLAFQTLDELAETEGEWPRGAGGFNETYAKLTTEELQFVFGERIPMRFVAIMTDKSYTDALGMRRALNRALAETEGQG